MSELALRRVAFYNTGAKRLLNFPFSIFNFPLLYLHSRLVVCCLSYVSLHLKPYKIIHFYGVFEGEFF